MEISNNENYKDTNNKDVIDVETEELLIASMMKSKNDNDDDDIAMKNLCVECEVDMGDDNPRQLCGKTRCLYSADNEHEESPNRKKKKCSSFLSMDQFMENAKKAKPTKWIDLDRTKIFRVTQVEELEVEQKSDATKRIANVAMLEDALGEIIRVWLPGIVAKELTRINVEEVDTYIRSLGPKCSTKSGRTYYNFEIVKN